MRTARWSMVAALVVGALIAAPAFGSQEHGESEGARVDPRDAVGQMQVGLAEAIAAALQARPGHAVEAEIEGEMGMGATLLISVEVLAADGLHEILVDAATGRVVADEPGDDAHEMAEARAYAEILRHAELSLAALIARATGVVVGTPVAAELAFEGATPLAEVLVANGRYLIEVELEARAGHVLEVELESFGLRDDEDGDDCAGDDDHGRDDNGEGHQDSEHQGQRRRHHEVRD